MEVEITTPLTLHPNQGNQLDFHSFVNILNILSGEIQLLLLDFSEQESLRECVDLVFALSKSIFDNGLNDSWAEGLAGFEELLKLTLQELKCDVSEAETLESIRNIDSILNVLNVRTTEYISRNNSVDKWTSHSISKLKDNFTKFFSAVEQNSKGRYRIISNIAEQEDCDYVVNLTIESSEKDTFVMPAELQDVFRDLIANARKYTPPGGVITAGMVEDETSVKLVVGDCGRGIPPEEIEKVVEFGYRATNVRHLPTKGGGFGLTKAYSVCKAFGGRMWIRSSSGKGTRVKIEIPRPAQN
jgi:signal transduction histidine kinase